MARRRHLKNAPIQEALIDIQFIPSAGVLDLAPVAERLVERFAASPNEIQIANLWEALYEVQARPDAAPTAELRTSSIDGKRIDFPSKAQVVQLKQTGYTFSRLPPYVDWNEASTPAIEMWSAFAALVKPAMVTRVAVRYLNAIELPMPVKDLAEYLPVVPTIPAVLPQAVANFMHRLVLPKDHLMGQVTQAIQGFTENRERLKVLVDIEVFCSREIDVRDDDALKKLLEELRAYKNDLFFEFLSDKTIERYE